MFKSVKRLSISANTISTFIEYLEDAFIVYKTQRYDNKGKSHIDSPFKYYLSD